MGNFLNKVAIVTGGANGIGWFVSKTIVAEGGKVGIFDIDQDAIERRKNKANSNFFFLNCDVGSEEEVKNSVDKVFDVFGSLDILVNNAGGSYALTRGSNRKKETVLNLLENTDLNFWNETINANLTSAFLCTKYAVPHMKQNGGGRIVNLSSKAARAAGRLGLGGTAYAAAKAGVIGLSKQLAYELGPHNITVNTVVPGITLTERVKYTWDLRVSDEVRDMMLQSIPLKRAALPEEMADAILFLCSDDASYITGVALDVNGGSYFA